MKAIKLVVLVMFSALMTACNVTPEYADSGIKTNSEYPSKARFKQQAYERANQYRESDNQGFFSAFLSSSEEYPSKQRFVQQGILKDAVLMQELRERKVGANHHIPELMQVAVTTSDDPRWVSITGHKRQHPDWQERSNENHPRFVSLRGPK